MADIEGIQVKALIISLLRCRKECRSNIFKGANQLTHVGVRALSESFIDPSVEFANASDVSINALKF